VSGRAREVDLVAAELDVGLGGREVVAGEEVEEVFLEVGAEAGALGAFEVDASELRLALGAAEKVGGDGALQVVDRALDRGDRDVVAAGGQEPSSSPSSNCSSDDGGSGRDSPLHRCRGGGGAAALCALES
jgi:hypothetical protein